MALLQMTLEVIAGAQTEIMIFIFAMCAHTVLFGGYGIHAPGVRQKRLRGGAAESGGKRPPQSPGSAALIRLARQLLRQDANAGRMVQELEKQLRALPEEDVSPALAGLLQHLGRTTTAPLLRAVRQAVRQTGLEPSARLQELLLRSCLGLDLQSDFREVFSEAEAAGGASPAMRALALKAALGAADLEAALEQLDGLATTLKASDGSAASIVPAPLLQQLAQLAGQRASLQLLLRRLVGCGPLAANAAEAVLVELARRGEAEALREAEQLVRAHGLELTGRAFGALLGAAGSEEDAERLISEAVEKRTVGPQLLSAAAEAALKRQSRSLAELALELEPEGKGLAAEQAARLFLLAAGSSDQDVLGLYERRFQEVDILADADAGLLVATAALRHERPDLLRRLLTASEGAEQAALLKRLGSERRLTEATAIFEACPVKTGALHNALLDACVESQDSAAAERVLAQAAKAKVADVATYNTIIRQYAQKGDVGRARGAFAAMRRKGLTPNCVTFNEMIDANIRTDPKAAWGIIDEMRAHGLAPSSVTCSILLKNVQRESKAAEVDRILEFIDAQSHVMDDVMLSSMCEACIRCGRIEQLSRELRRLKEVQLNSPFSFGSVIRAYGLLEDVDNAWRTWNEMRARNIVPTSITIGCMVEALAQNGRPGDGHALVRELLREPATRPLVNAIIYCSVLKGFGHQKQFDRVWAICEEMRAENIKFSIVTYNALIDACARAPRGCEMPRVERLLEEMSREGIEPNLVTCTTVLKGYCQEGQMSKAFKLLQEMKQSPDFRPDEITYNTLIDGCARNGLYKDGMATLREMQQAGVAPSAFTLSVLVKLAARGSSTKEAFELCESLSRKYRIKLNVYVYNNLVNACTADHDLTRAFEVFCRMLREGVRPDARTYTLLLRSCIAGGAAQEAAGLLRAAAGLPGAEPRLLAAAGGGLAALQPKGDLASDLVTEVLEALAGPLGRELLAVQLLRELFRTRGRVRVDPGLSRRWAAKAGVRGF